MEEENHGAQQEEEEAQPEEAQDQEVAPGAEASVDYEKAIAERDEQIASLQEQVAAAAKSAETAEALQGQIAELEAQAAAEREEFALKSAGCRSVKAARALLEGHGGDVAALKEAEPWLFQDAPPQSGKTGLEPKGAAVDDNKTLKRWRRLAGLTEE